MTTGFKIASQSIPLISKQLLNRLKLYQQSRQKKRISLFIKYLTFLVVLGCLKPVQAQKKSPYADYWEQEANREKFELYKKDALQHFRAGTLDSAVLKYNKALELIPGDQEVIARIRDIQLLKDKKAAEAQATKPKLDTASSEYYKTSPLTEVQTIEVKDTFRPNTSPTPPAEEIHPIERSAPEEISLTDKAPAAKITQPAAEPERPFKNSENYKKYLATVYKSGWTEERYKESTREIVKRVFVQKDKGTEYLKVTHHYGAVFYFRNGESISKSSWISETGKE